MHDCIIMSTFTRVMKWLAYSHNLNTLKHAQDMLGRTFTKIEA